MAQLEVEDNVAAAIQHLHRGWAAEGSNLSLSLLIEHMVFGYIREAMQESLYEDNTVAREAFQILLTPKTK